MTRFGLVCVLVALPFTGTSAQSSLGLRVGIARYFGATRAVTGNPDDAAVRPFRPTTVGLEVGRDWGRVRVELGVEYGAPGLAGEIQDGKFISPNDATFYALQPEVSVRLFKVGDGVLRGGAGPVFTLWYVTGFDPRILAGGEGALTYEWPVVARLLGAVRFGVSFSPSVFTRTELPAELERRMMVRPSIALGLRYR